MTLEQLRLAHPTFTYKSYAVSLGHGVVDITYEFVLEPGLVFRPKLTIPYHGNTLPRLVESCAFHLGLVEAVSYWKAACPKEIIVEAGVLTEDELRFWFDLYIHGLGEFFYRNDIDFSTPEFLVIRSGTTKEAPVYTASDVPRLRGDLVLVGGGKDSAVTVGILKKTDRTLQTMILNPTAASRRTVELSGLPRPLEVKRQMDPTLFRLNKKGYLNGHTPFSAYLAFLGITVATLHGYEHVIVSNEKSANEGNVMFHGIEVNHQYSKSYRFEQQFREYVKRAFPAPPEYFSMLRPLNDLQISLLFSRFPAYFRSFRSCNVGSSSDTWCGRCPKCAFTFLVLRPFVSHEHMMTIFGADILMHPEVVGHVRALTGLTPVKPFECVGTRDEAKLAVIMAVEAYKRENVEIPEGLLKIKSDLALTAAELARLKEEGLENWGDTYNVPPEHLTLLRDAWQRAVSQQTEDIV